MHHEVIAEIRKGQGIEGVLKEDGKVVQKWNISAKRTTPVLEVLRALELASFGGYVVVEIKVSEDLIGEIPDVDSALDIYGVNITRLSEA